MRTMMVPAAVAFALSAQLGLAHADDIHGRPLQNGNKCFQYSAGQAKDARFGYWDACPQNASAHIPARVPVGTTVSEAATVPPATRVWPSQGSRPSQGRRVRPAWLLPPTFPIPMPLLIVTLARPSRPRLVAMLPARQPSL